MKRQLLALLLLLVGLGCRETAVADLPPETIVQNAAERMNSLDGFRFLIVRDGAPAYVDPPVNQLIFRQAEGDFVAPDKAQALVRVLGLGLVTEVRVVTVAEIQWQTNPLTGQWEELPPDLGFNPAVLFDEQVGLQTVLAEDMFNLALVGIETLEDGPNGRFYHVRGELLGDRLFTMSGTLIGPQAVTADLWIAPESFELVRAIVTEPEAEEPSIWQVDFSEFGEVVPISPPVE